MAGRTMLKEKSRAGSFFSATLVLWTVSLWFEILFDRRFELLYLVFGALFYQSANSAIRFLISKEPLVVNTAVSLLHSIITSASVLFVLVNRWLSHGSDGMFEHSQLFGGTWPWAYAALCFSCGYFAYDQWDMLQYRLYSGWIPAILVHHLVLLICFTLALYRNVTINYLILTLICELHSIFLHVRRLRRMAGVRDAESFIVKVEWTLNWLTFIFARFVPHILITAKLIMDASKFDKGVELPLALFGMAAMNLLNVFLGIDLFNAVKKESNYQKNDHLHNE
ncbi:TLC domain-containing protein 2 [Cucurbita pepo subsp. pepo]|uniref:TLC domain-containing protein 2 n=1 Tax=Cucurbita pepo subsp. pepo TaxID=3664 RepID=UPI000C9D2873|nr:TLC domain-containing protein 2 [Cucurbita pepo subsp. pepo]